MASQSYTLAITQGSTFTLSCALVQAGVAFDLTGYTMTGKIRNKFSDAAATVSLTCTIDNAAGGLFTLSLTATQTAALALPSGYPSPDANRLATIGSYDVEITSAPTIIRILEGSVTLSQEATK